MTTKTKSKMRARRKVSALERLSTGIPELDRVLGGGFVPGSTVLISGPPGSGKSTLAVQIAAGAARGACEALYASGEQSKEDICGIARRARCLNDHVRVLGRDDVSKIMEAAESNTCLLIIDTVQTAYTDKSTAVEGSQWQVRAVVDHLVEFSRRENVCTVMLSHTNRRGEAAVPAMVEHVVDVVLELDPYGESDSPLEPTHTLRATKNRYGSIEFAETNFKMTAEGFVSAED